MEDFEKLADKLLWRPIETAPMDGASVLLACEHGVVQEGHYEPDDKGWWLAQCHPTDYWDGQVFPLAWMPMPDPPFTDEQKLDSK